MEDEAKKYSVDQKWGAASKAGFSQVPDVLLKAQNALGLSSTELVVLLNINMAWWEADRMPFPSAAGIARRMGLGPRTVERAVNSLVDKGLIRKRSISGQRGRRNVYDLSPLVERLSRISMKDPYYLAQENGYVGSKE